MEIPHALVAKPGTRIEATKPALGAGPAKTTTVAHATENADGAAASSKKKLDLGTLFKRCRSSAK